MTADEFETEEITADADAMTRIRASRAEVEAGDVLTAEELAELVAAAQQQHGDDDHR